MRAIYSNGYKYFGVCLVVFFLAWQKWKCVAFLHDDGTSSHRKVVIHVPLQIKHLTRTVVKVIEKPIVKEFKHDGEIIHHHHHSGHIEHDHSHDIHSPMSQHQNQNQNRRGEESIASAYSMAGGGTDADMPLSLPLRQYQRRRARVNSTTISERNVIRDEAPVPAPKNHARRVSEYATASYRRSANWPRSRSKLEHGAITTTTNAVFDADNDGINDVAGMQPQRQRRFHRRPNNFRVAAAAAAAAAGDTANARTGYLQNAGRNSYVRVLLRQFVKE